MKVDADAQLSFPREQVFQAYRDRLTEMVPFLDNIDSIVEESRRDEGNVSHIVNVWRSGDADLPKLARSVIKPEMLAWRDHAKWNAEQWTCEWRVEHLAFGQAVDVAEGGRLGLDEVPQIGDGPAPHLVALLGRDVGGLELGLSDLTIGRFGVC